jgi:hypothetical protein
MIGRFEVSSNERAMYRPVLRAPLAAPPTKACARSWVVAVSTIGVPGYTVELAVGTVPSVV